MDWNDAMSTSLRANAFEKRELTFLSHFLQTGMTVLDIGAHHGFYTLLASQRVGPHGCVIAFEPSARELRRLRWNLALNRCRNVRVEPLALGSHDGAAELFVCMGIETGCNSLRAPSVPESTRPTLVRVTTMDSYLEKHPTRPIDFVKLDVEGAEMDFLRGASRFLSSDSRPVIMCELADVRTEAWGYHSLEIYDTLALYGYQWFSVTPEGKLRPCPRKEQYHENLIAVPEDKLSAIADFLEGEDAPS